MFYFLEILYGYLFGIKEKEQNSSETDLSNLWIIRFEELTRYHLLQFKPQV